MALGLTLPENAHHTRSCCAPFQELMATMRILFCLSLAWCYIAACNAAERRRHPSPPAPPSDCPFCQGDEDIPSPGQFEYYVLAKFSQDRMHGLWPNNCNECPQWFPQHCSEENFDITAIPDDTHSRMKQIWKSAPQFGSDEDFWEHEWICHGTCSGFDIATYFTTAVRLFDSCHKNHCCFTKGEELGDCPDVCEFDPGHHNHQLQDPGSDMATSSVIMTSARALLSHNPPDNKYCAPASGTCQE